MSILAIMALAALTLGGATAIAADQARTRSQERDQSSDCAFVDCQGDRTQTRAQDCPQLRDSDCGDCGDCDPVQAQTQAKAGAQEQVKAQAQVKAGAQEQVKAQTQVKAGAQEQFKAQTQERAQAQEPVPTQTKSQEQTRLQDGTCDGDQTQTQARDQDCTQLQEGTCEGDQVQEQCQDQLRDGSCGDGQQSQTRVGAGRCGA